MTRRASKVIAFLAAAASLVTLALALTTAPAGAATALIRSNQAPTVLGVPMTLDCTRLSASARKYADAHGYCAKSGEAAPDNQVSGNCGSAYIYVANLGLGGYARFYYGFTSTWGSVTWRSLNIAWSDYSSNRADFLIDEGNMNSASYSSQRDDGTGTGIVNATLGGYVDLWWGGECDIDYPSAWAAIT